MVVKIERKEILLKGIFNIIMIVVVFNNRMFIVRVKRVLIFKLKVDNREIMNIMVVVVVKMNMYVFCFNKNILLRLKNFLDIVMGFKLNCNKFFFNIFMDFLFF